MIRKIQIVDDLALVPLSGGHIATIDAADVALVAGRNWQSRPRGLTIYAVRFDRSGSERKTIYLHRLIMGMPTGWEVDHIDCNGLNNCRSNLRLATRQGNVRNTRIRKDNKTGFKGVIVDAPSGQWRARIKTNGKLKHLGLFASAEAAHAAYCEAARELHGDFARTA